MGDLESNMKIFMEAIRRATVYGRRQAGAITHGPQSSQDAACGCLRDAGYVIFCKTICESRRDGSPVMKCWEIFW